MARNTANTKALTETNDKANSISYAPEVIAIIIGVAANEVEGVAGMVNVNGGIRSRNKGITRGIKVEVGSEEVSCELYLNVEYGNPIQKVAQDVQESVRKAIEAMTGLHVVRVDVHVQGVSFEKENNAITAGAQKASLTDETSAKEEVVLEEPAVEEQAETEEAPAEEPAAEEVADEAAEEKSIDAE